MASRIEKGQDLLNFAKEEVEKVKTRELERLSTYRVLGKKFDCSAATVLNYLNRAGIKKEINFLKKDTLSENLTPSYSLAWMLGILAGGGENSLAKGKICLSSSDEYLLEKFKFIGQELFRTNPTICKRYTQKNGKDYQIVTFFSHKMTTILGNFKREKWPDTLVGKYQWISMRQEYLWKFLEGFFETRGTIILRPKHRSKGISFNTRYPHVASFIAELLSRAGIEKPRIEKKAGVVVSNSRDVKIIASNIHSVSPNKEKVLEFFRG